MPELTVLMTVYNGLPYLSLAIESILKQTFTDFEFLIVNDASTDQSREAILSYDDPRIRLFDNEVNLNQTRSLNRGLEHTRTELVARMDADDVSHPERLEKQLAFLKRYPDVTVVGSQIRWIDPAGKFIRTESRPKRDLGIRWMNFFSCPLSGGAMMFRKSIVWNELGGYNPRVKLAQDWELCSRMAGRYRLANLPEPLLDVRSHPKASSVIGQDVIRLESEKIRQTNLERILASKSRSDNGLDQLKKPIASSWRCPEVQLTFVRKVFEHFCEEHPEASKDPEVLTELSMQCVKLLAHSRFYHLRLWIELFHLAGLISPQKAYQLWRMSRKVGGVTKHCKTAAVTAS